MEKQQGELETQKSQILELTGKLSSQNQELTQDLESAKLSIQKAEAGLEEQKTLNKELQTEAQSSF